MPISKFSFIPRLRKFPRTFYLYIFSEVMTPFFGAMFFFLFVLMMFQVVRMAEFFIVHSVPFGMIFKIMLYMSLTFVPIVIPIAFLLAVLMGMGRLSGDSEIIAMRASGLSIYSILKPVLFLGILVSLINLFTNCYIVPWGSRMFRYEIYRISNQKAIATIREGTFTEGFFGMVLYSDKVDSKKNTMEKVLIYDERSPRSPVSVVAKSGKILSNYQDSKGIPGILLRLFDGSMHRSIPEKNSYEMVQFETYDIFLGIEIGRIIGVERPKTMDIGTLKIKMQELLDLPQKTKEVLAEIRQYEVEYWKRFALSVAATIFAIMGVAFGVVRTRTVRSNSFIICIVVLLFYWVLHTIGENAANDGRIPAIFGMWISNAILLVVAIASLRKVVR